MWLAAQQPRFFLGPALPVGAVGRPGAVGCCSCIRTPVGPRLMSRALSGRPPSQCRVLQSSRERYQRRVGWIYGTCPRFGGSNFLKVGFLPPTSVQVAPSRTLSHRTAVSTVNPCLVPPAVVVCRLLAQGSLPAGSRWRRHSFAFLSAEKTHKFLLFSNKSEFVNASILEFNRMLL